MLTASVLLLVIGLLGAFDVFYFHHRGRLVERRESRREAWIHVARGPIYAAQFLLVPNVRFTGKATLFLLALFAVDALVAALDVLEEPRSRAEAGGLPRGEYFMHVVLSVLVGAMLHSALGAAWAARSMSSAVTIAPIEAPALRLALFFLAVGVLAHATWDALTLIAESLGAPRPLHVSVRLPASVEKVWEVTQDHVLHPRWDHRFDRIDMLASRIETGTRMHYEKSLLGITIRGYGRYKLHRPLVQSTFEFGSDDPRSLIRRGVGLWRYRATADGATELSTSYTYEVRWGRFGRFVDLVFRPLFQRETERSFYRLARDFFGVSRPVVAGRTGRKRAVLAPASPEAA